MGRITSAGLLLTVTLAGVTAATAAAYASSNAAIQPGKFSIEGSYCLTHPAWSGLAADYGLSPDLGLFADGAFRPLTIGLKFRLPQKASGTAMCAGIGVLGDGSGFSGGVDWHCVLTDKVRLFANVAVTLSGNEIDPSMAMGVAVNVAPKIAVIADMATMPTSTSLSIGARVTF